MREKLLNAKDAKNKAKFAKKSPMRWGFGDCGYDGFGWTRLESI